MKVTIQCDQFHGHDEVGCATAKYWQYRYKSDGSKKFLCERCADHHSHLKTKIFPITDLERDEQVIKWVMTT